MHFTYEDDNEPLAAESGNTVEVSFIKPVDCHSCVYGQYDLTTARNDHEDHTKDQRAALALPIPEDKLDRRNLT